MEGRTISRTRGAGARARGASQHNTGAAAEIRLAPAMPPSGFLHRQSRKLWELTHKRRVTVGSLLVTDDALVIDAPAELRGRLVIPWGSVRKAVIDDGGRWGYVSEVCRFPVYADRPDGSGNGTLIGPLWSHASSLMPADASVVELDPVPARPPNLALIFEPSVPAPSLRGQSYHGQSNGNGSAKPDSLVGLLVCADDPDAARTAIASRSAFGDVDHADLDYLIRLGR